MRDQTPDSLFNLLDVPQFFNLTGSPQPPDADRTLEVLQANALVVPGRARHWDITQLGAVLLATDLENFPVLKDKAARVIQYEGISRIEINQTWTAAKGYANGFEELLSTVWSLLPTTNNKTEKPDSSITAWPESALRELIINALVHQNFSKTRMGPLIEIFQDRIEIANSGASLVEPQRMINAPPNSRNESMTSIMRLMGLVNGSGSGWDTVVASAEQHGMPAPLAKVEDDWTRVILLSPRSLTDMNREDRIGSVYQHACLQFANGSFLTNASLRMRFNIEDKNSAIASRLIKEAVAANAIIPCEANIGRKHMRYVPWWADAARQSFI